MPLNNIPGHIAFILDGNGRWAKKHKLPRNAGHVRGAKTVEKIIRECGKLGVKYVTLYAFSTENWNRPQDEVDALMKLLKDYIARFLKNVTKDNMVVKVIGDKTKLNKDLRLDIKELENKSKINNGVNVILALNYGSRDEINRAIKKIATKVKNNKLDIKDINENLISKHLDTHGIPEPDLLIRTSGEVRLSNFMMWQLSYTELYFTNVLWPDFSRKDLIKAIEAYAKRNRRFGKI